MPMFEVSRLFKTFGGIRACDDVSFAVERNEVLGLIGPNGSGKTTVLNLIAGFHAPDSGRILLDGSDLVGQSANAISRRGVCRAWQDPRIIPGISVYENIELGMLAQGSRSTNAAAIGTLLEQLDLERHAHEVASELPYGMQKMVALARTLAARPSLLLLDEPLAGLSESEIHRVTRLVRAHTERGSVIIVDHAFGTMMDTCDRVVVLNSGRKVVEGLPAEVRAHPTVAEVYFGHKTEQRFNAAPEAVTSGGSVQLEVRDVTAGYHGKKVVSDIDFEAQEGECVALLGVNGAGKTTCFRALVGLLPLQGGRVSIGGAEVSRDAAANARGGFVLVPEGARSFQSLTVRENLQMGGFVLQDWDELQARMDQALTLLPKLRERLDQKAGNLSGGERQMLAVARALMLAPRVLLLDEPFLGLAPIMIDEVAAQLEHIRRTTGCTIVLAEQHVSATMRTADRAIVLVQGRIEHKIDDARSRDAEEQVTAALLA